MIQRGTHIISADHQDNRDADDISVENADETTAIFRADTISRADGGGVANVYF